MLPARSVCRTNLDPCPFPVLVPRVGFDPTSSALHADAFTRLASSAYWSGRWGTIPRLLLGKQELCL